MKLNTHKIYYFDFTGQLTFGSVPPSVLYKIFTDGRFCSEPLSFIFQDYFDDLEYVDKIGYDFIGDNDKKIEQKQLTKASGLKFCPSNMIGAKRNICYDTVVKHIQDLNLLFLIPDITQFPIVKAILLPGKSY